LTPMNFRLMFLFPAFNDSFEFLGCSPAMVVRIIPVPLPPEDTPDNTKRAEGKERVSPTCEPHDCNNKRRRKRTAKSRAHEQNAVSIPDLASWKPSRKATGHGWECARFAHTKEKSCRKKNGEIPRNSRCHCERRPPDHNPRHHSARAHDIRKPAT